MWLRFKSLIILLCFVILIVFCVELVFDNIKLFFKLFGILEVSYGSLYYCV